MERGVEERLMREALREALSAYRAGEVPVGAVVADAGGEVLSRGRNRALELRDPTAHAEVLALREACFALGSERLERGCVLATTLEPCAMCAGAISFARVDVLLVGAWDEKGGAVRHGGRFFESSGCFYAPKRVSGGVMEGRCAGLLRGFFRERRA